MTLYPRVSAISLYHAEPCGEWYVCTHGCTQYKNMSAHVWIIEVWIPSQVSLRKSSDKKWK